MSKFYDKNAHWADQQAERILAQRGGESYVSASGITPSGVVHIGNFREIISVEVVHRALLDRGKQSRFIHSWDDFDAFRKVPSNIPQNKEFEKYLRLPIVDIPDPWGNESSYAKSFESAVESVLPELGIFPEYIYQTQNYRNANYAEGIRRALEKRDRIRSILNEFREKPLPETWWPVTVFSRFTGNDRTTVLSWDGEWLIRYFCQDSNREDTLDLRSVSAQGKSAEVKLFWRIDWPMRWKYEKVDFEPAGKEHHSAGGSFDTAKQISAEVYSYQAPLTFKYDFVSIKGQGGKISSSLGNVLSIEDVLNVYQAEVLRYLFVSTRPDAEFAISFDLDVIKIYEDYDRCERIFYGLEDAKEKRRCKEGRIYELCQLEREEPSGAGSRAGENASEQEMHGRAPSQKSEVGEASELLQFPFRHLCNALLIHNGDAEAALLSLPGAEEWFASEGERSEASDPPATGRRGRALRRANCAWFWLQNYAPDEFTFRCRTADDLPLKLGRAELEALLALRRGIEDGVLERSDKELQNEIYEIAGMAGLDPKDFFIVLYRVIIGKDRGPRLASFLKTIGGRGVLEIFSAYGKLS